MCLFSVSACDTGALRRSSEDGSVGILMTEQLLHRMPRFLSFHKLGFHLPSVFYQTRPRVIIKANKNSNFFPKRLKYI